MTPQSNFMVVVPVDPKHETELRQLLDSMNQGPGQVDPNNALIPFAKFDTLHFARFVILDDKTTEDVRVYRLTPRSYPLYLAFLGDVDGDANAFLDQACAQRLEQDFFVLRRIHVRYRSSRVDEATPRSCYCCLCELARTNGAPDSRRSSAL